MEDPPLPLTLPWWVALAIFAVWLVAVVGIVRVGRYLIRSRRNRRPQVLPRDTRYADLRRRALPPHQDELDP